MVLRSAPDGAASLAGSQAPIAAHILIVEARFYEDIADDLVSGAIAELEARGATYERVTVPGALEIPQALGLAAETLRFVPAEDRIDEGGPAEPRPFDGAIILGCVIRGETAHYDVVCNNANHWTMELAMAESIPLGNGLLTVDTPEQAHARASGGRAGKGGDAARACLALVALRRHFRAEWMAAPATGERTS